MLIKVFINLISCLLFTNRLMLDANQEFQYRVVLPEYICANQGQTDKEYTTIRIFGENASNLHYNWTVGFKMSDSKSNQRQTLLHWKSVRKLEDYFRGYSSNDSNGLILLNNTMLTAGIKYFVNVSAYTSDQKIADNQEVSFEYITNLNSDDLKASVSVFGPDVIYSDMTYVATAEVNICSNITDYELSWQLLDNNEKIVSLKSTNSRILQLPPGLMVSGSKNGVRCTITSGGSSKNAASSVLWVHVLKRGAQLVPYVSNITAGVKQPMRLAVYFRSPEERGLASSIEWNCTNTANEPCAAFESCNCTELILSKGFSSPGSFIVSVGARVGNVTSTSFMNVKIVKDEIPLIDIENVVIDHSPAKMLIISAHVSQLTENCAMQWSCVNQTGYKYIDLNRVPDAPGKVMIISKNGGILDDELNDLDNDISSKQFDLVLPAPTNGNWKGLDGNSKYLFRITAYCESTNRRAQDEVVKAVTEVTVHTNAAPIVKPLTVTPLTGTALRTMFTWSTSRAKDYSSDVPLLYKFGYLNDKQKRIFLISQYDNTNAWSKLPYQDKPIQTAIEVCDSKGACNFTLGPKVIVVMPDNFTQQEASAALEDFRKMIFEQDYFSAFMLASMMAKTVKKVPYENIYNDVKKHVEIMTKNKINTLLNTSSDVWIESASNLLKYIKILEEEYYLPDEMFHVLLSLRDKIFDYYGVREVSSEKIREFNSRSINEKPNKRIKRIINDINLIEIKDYLEISEMAINRLTDAKRVEIEKQSLRKKLNSYAQSVCLYLYNYYKTDVKIALSSFYFSVEKINLSRKYKDYLLVPYDLENEKQIARIQLGRDVAKLYGSTTGLCISKTLFIKDYFNLSQNVYNVRLHSAMYEPKLDASIDDYTIVVFLPSKTVIRNNELVQCAVMTDSTWDRSRCSTVRTSESGVQCACTTLGYFSIVPRTPSVPIHSDVVHVTPTKIYTTLGHSLVTSDQIKIPTSRPTSQDDRINYRKADNLQITVVALIGIFAFGIICSVIIGIFAYKKMKSYTMQLPAQTAVYGKYFDEQNLNDA